jgi:drug/metabolite transporter (DMT)-like permease
LDRPAGAGAPTLGRALAGWALFIAVETLTQVVFKFAGATLNDGQGFVATVLHAATNPIVVLGFILYFCGFLIWMTILKTIDMGRAFPMTGAIYVATLAAAVLVFHEALNLTRIVGVVAIIAGVVLMASDEDSAP